MIYRYFTLSCIVIFQKEIPRLVYGKLKLKHVFGITKAVNDYYIGLCYCFFLSLLSVFQNYSRFQCLSSNI